MQTEFKDAKLNFYMSLRKDELVKSLGTEMKIRELTEKITLYKDHLNRAENVYDIMDSFQKGDHEKKQGRSPGGLKIYLQDGSFIEFDGTEIYAGKFLDFADVKGITYCIGTYQDKRNLIQRLLIKENPLEERVKEYMLCYKRFKKTGVFEAKYIGEDLMNEVGCDLEGKLGKEPGSRSLSRITVHACCEYISRGVNLVGIANSGEVIKGYYSDEKSDFLNKGIKGGLDEGTIRSMQEKKLTNKEIDQIAGYFRYQAEINGFISRMLYTHFLKLNGDTDLEGKAEEFCGCYMNNYA